MLGVAHLGLVELEELAGELQHGQALLMVLAVQEAEQCLDAPLGREGTQVLLTHTAHKTIGGQARWYGYLATL